MGLFNRGGRSSGAPFTSGRHGTDPGAPQTMLSGGLAGRVRRAAERLLTPQGLANAAGMTRVEHFEPLEQRQLLFTMSISAADVDPSTGLGTRREFFAYRIPYLATDQDPPDDLEPTIETEPFDDEDLGAVGSGPGAQWDQSGFYPVHNIQPASDFSIVLTDPTQPQSQEQELRVNLNAVGEFFQFTTAVLGNAAQERVAQGVSFAIRPDSPRSPGDVSGLDLDNISITLLLNNVVQGTFTGRAEITPLFLPGGNAALGTGTLSIGTGLNFNFDSIRVTQNAGFNPALGPSFFEVDDLTFTFLVNPFGELFDSQIFGAVVVLSGPVGASVQLSDLYGRSMRRTLAMGIPSGGDRNPLGDLNRDGVGDFNEGIGSINISGTDARSSITVWGGEITAVDEPPDDADFFENGFAFRITTALTGLFDDFEEAGFGYAVNVDDDTVTVGGLPTGSGSVIIGAPIVRPLNNFNPFGIAGPPVLRPGGNVDFNNVNQGFFIRDGSALGSLNAHAIVHGSSVMNSSVDKIALGYLLGSFTVSGDVGTFWVSSDSGSWTLEPDFTFDDPNVQRDAITVTNSQLVFGRTIMDFSVAGRNVSNITVLGDINQPASRPPRDVFDYDEREFVDPFPDDADERFVVGQNVFANNIFGARINDLLVRLEEQVGETASIGQGGQAVVYGTSFYRNDSISSAEFIGSIATGVRVRGELSSFNPILDEDAVDVYAFVVDGTTEVAVEAVSSGNGIGPYIRIVDADGRTLAAPEGFEQEQGQRRFRSSQIRFRPEDGPGVYYLVVTDPNGVEDGLAAAPYTFVITGMAPTTFGSYRTGGGSGFGAVGTTGFVSNFINVNSGNVGVVRVGMGYADGSGNDTDPTELYNTEFEADDSLSFQGGTFTVAGNLFAVVAGGDIGAPLPDTSPSPQTRVTFNIAGNLGTLLTGRSPVVGGGVGEGDVNFLSVNTGGAIGRIDITGGVGIDQDNDGNPRGATAFGMSLTTGTANRPGVPASGDIGSIRVGFHVAAAVTQITTSPGSTIGSFLISQDAYFDTTDTRVGFFGVSTDSQGRVGSVRLNTGINSDIRFIDFPQIDLIADDEELPLLGDQDLILTDDSGARVNFRVSNAPAGVPVGTIRRIPVNSGQGVAIGAVEVDLSGGRILTISGIATNPGNRVSLGRLIITGDATSAVVIEGSAEVDILRIEANGGLGSITNSTIGGDLVQVDVATLNTLDIRGDLGFTQTNRWGPQTYAPRLGLAAGPGGTVGGPVGFLAEPGEGDDGRTVDVDFNGGIYRPIADEDTGAGNAYFDDIGSFIDETPNGLIVRGGSVVSVRVEGRVGDVLLQGGEAVVLGTLTVNADNRTPINEFHGLLGAVYAGSIGSVDVGDGIARANQFRPIGVPGVFAVDNLGSVTANRRAGGPQPIIGGVITARNLVPGNAPVDSTDGITSLNFDDALIEGAFFSTGVFDEYWASFNYGQDRVYFGDMGTVSLKNSRFFRSTIRSFNAGSIDGQGATFDASTITMLGDLSDVRFKSYRNSTTTGTSLEFAPTLIEVSRNIERLTATEDISDVIITAFGEVRRLDAALVNRSVITGASLIQQISVSGDLRGSDIAGGRLENLQVGGNIASSTLNIRGEIATVRATTIRNTEIFATGPNSRINSIQATGGISADITSEGPIGTITTTQNDLDLGLTTRSVQGDVGQLTAGRDVVLRGEVGGNLQGIQAGRNIGRLNSTGSLLVRGDIANVRAPGGTLYNDLRSGGRINSVQLGGVSSRAGSDLVGRGSLVASAGVQSVTIAGDFAGSIVALSGNVQSVTVTNGSLLPGARVEASSGNVQSLTITNGSLFADVIAGGDIATLRVEGGTSGVFGDVGINPDRSAFVPADALRNQLPIGVGAGVGRDGPTIRAGGAIRSVTISGSVFEAGFIAGTTIDSITIGGRVANNLEPGEKYSFFVAGERIVNLRAGILTDALVLAGVTSLGSDNLPGGVDAAADTVRSGSIGTITASQSLGVTYVAGVLAGANGVYGDDFRTPGNESADDVTALGVSTIERLTVSGLVLDSEVIADTLPGALAGDGRFRTRAADSGNSGRVNLNPALFNTALGLPGGTQFTGSRTFGVNGVNYTINLQGAGQAFFATSGGFSTLVLVNTTSSSNLTLSSSNGFLDNLTITTNNNAALGSLRFDSTVRGSVNVTVDGAGNELRVASSAFTRSGSVLTAPSVVFGEALGRVEGTGTWGGLNVSARAINEVRAASGLGSSNPADLGEASVSARTIGGVNVTGALRGLISADRSLGSVSVSGTIERSQIRSGGAIAGINANALRTTTVSAGGSINSVSIQGDVFDSSISAGLDLGPDGQFSAIAGEDLPTGGNIGNVNITGNFQESDITAGVGRGPDRFFGTGDDRFTAGRSNIGSVTIGGDRVGSARNSESYRIIATGSIGNVTIAGQVANGAVIGNFAVEAERLAPVPIRVVDLDVAVDAGVYTASITFNQPMDESTLRSAIGALSVSEVRGQGEVEIRLVEGLDYQVFYNDTTDTLLVRFDRRITSQNLPQVPGTPGPGVYRFRIDAELASARLGGVGIDGNSDGRAVFNDDFVGQAVVGDAGDKLVPSRVNLPTGAVADLYAPVDLNILLDNPFAIDALPEVNRTVTIAGFIGDHPDNDTVSFPAQGDVDLYRVTLLAGQILRLSQLSGGAERAGIALLQADGTTVPILSDNEVAISLPVPSVDLNDRSAPAQSYLIRQTATYIIAVGNTATVDDETAINAPEPGPGLVGAYRFSVEIFDDGDSGFSSTSDSGNGALLVTPPDASAFAGPDNILGTADDASQLVVNDYIFTRNASTGEVSGSNESGVVSRRFANGRVEQSVDSAIGGLNPRGLPNDIAADVDVFHLNGRQPIGANTRVRLTLRLSDTGSDLGSRRDIFAADFRGAVQLGFFDTTASTGLDDATLVFSPTDILPFGGPANTTIADNGATRYGFDSRGDYFIEFLTPATTGTYAVYVQGVYNTDYRLEVVLDGTGAPIRERQNFLLELSGGSVDWLEVGQQVTNLPAFDIRQIGFNGSLQSGQLVSDFVVSELVTRLNALFQNAGLDVVFATTPSAFEFEEFSTIFLSGGADPITSIFDSFNNFNFDQFFAGNALNAAFNATQPFGFSQRSDPFNADRSDEAVVFVPSFALQSYANSQNDLSVFTNAITAAVARRAGELMGARITLNNNNATNDPFASDSVGATITQEQGGYAINNAPRRLSNLFDSVVDTDFFLGRQRALSLLLNNVRAR